MIEISDISSGNKIELTQPNNLSKATLPPHHAVGFRFFFSSNPGFRRYRASTPGLLYAAHIRGLPASSSPTPRLAYLGSPKARRGLYYNEERPCGRGEELTLFVEKNALRLLRRLRWGAKRRTRVARRVFSGLVRVRFLHASVSEPSISPEGGRRLAPSAGAIAPKLGVRC